MKATAVARHLAGVFTALRDLLALVGVAVILGFALVQLRGPMLEAAPAPAADPFDIGWSLPEGPVQVAATESAYAREQRALAEFIAKRYRVAESAAAGFVSNAYRAGEQHSVDPVLILAVMAVESRYNPVAESVVGAKGLMQVIAKYHPEKLEEHGGESALLDPEVNILVGAQILREYQRRFRDTETALQMYAGAFDEPTAQYAAKVFAEKARLEALRRKVKKQTA